MTASKRVQQSAMKFLRKLDDGTDWNNLDMDSPERAAREAVVSAFLLYEVEWRSHQRDIREWSWPITQLTDESLSGGERFDGDEPWSVLFRHAMSLLVVSD